MQLPAVGSLAPDFTLLTDQGTSLTLSSLRGGPVVLFFYPKDNTPTCTVEACEFRDAFPKFKKSKATILGISPDSYRKHANFRKKFKLPYTLLADTEKVVVGAYDVWQQKTFWGRKYMGVMRTTILIDSKGMIARVFEDVKAEGHADEVMEAIAALR